VSVGRRTILLIEDEQAISEPLAAALLREGFEPVVAGTAADGMARFRSLSPDVVLLDVMLPDGDGRDLLREIRAESRTPVLMLTARGEELDRVQPAGENRVLESGDVRVDLDTHQATLAGEPLDLTVKEFELLRVLLSRAGKLVRREELVREVWDENWFGSSKTLDVHVSALRRKLGDDPAEPRHIHTIRGVGFRLAGPDDPA
jgi:DNA-binding response OmpR family regulator